MFRPPAEDCRTSRQAVSYQRAHDQSNQSTGWPSQGHHSPVDGAVGQTPSQPTCEQQRIGGGGVACPLSEGLDPTPHQDELSWFYVGEMPPSILAEIANSLNRENNDGAIRLATYLRINFSDFLTFQKQPSPSLALFKMCVAKDMTMDKIVKGLEETNSESVKFIWRNLKQIKEFVISNRCAQTGRCDPQQNTESYSSMPCSESPGSPLFTCYCDSTVDSTNSGHTHDMSVTPPSGLSNRQPLHTSQFPHSHTVYNQPPSLKRTRLGSSTENIATARDDRQFACYQAQDQTEKLPIGYTVLDKHTDGRVTDIFISNPSSDEESLEGFPMKRDVYIFITGGNSPEEMMQIVKFLRDLKSLPCQLIWDSSHLSEEPIRWEQVFRKAALVVIGVTNDYVNNIGLGEKWMSRAYRINQYVQRELLNKFNKNKRFINVIITQSGLKKSSMPVELSGTPYMWPNQKKLLMERITQKLGKK